MLLRIYLGNFVVNDFESWGVVAGNAVAAVIEGLLLWLLVFRLAVRRVERRHGTGPATGAAIVGGLAGLLAGAATVLGWVALVVYAVGTKAWPVG